MLADKASAERYLKRAAEMRKIASQVDQPDSRETLLKSAESFERMAEWTPIEPMFRCQ